MVTIREVSPDDRDAVMPLADRLTAGVAPWRAPDRVLQAVREWVVADLNGRGADGTVYVAADDSGVVGFVSVGESTHWSGEVDGYIGELVIDPEHEHQGVAKVLVRAAERWAAGRGLRRVRLSTGAANTAALGLYDALGYQREDVTLSKRVEP